MIDNAQKSPRNGHIFSKKELFVEKYLKCFNQTEAAIKAGYSDNGARTRGSLLMKDPYIQELLKIKLEERKQQLLYDEMYVIEGLKEIHARCLQKHPMEDKEEGRGEFDSGGAIRALELLGRHIGMFNPKLAAIRNQGAFLQVLPTIQIHITQMVESDVASEN